MAMVHSSFYGIMEVEPPSAANGNNTPGKSIVDCKLRNFIPLDPQCYSPTEDCCWQLRGNQAGGILSSRVEVSNCPNLRMFACETFMAFASLRSHRVSHLRKPKGPTQAAEQTTTAATTELPGQIARRSRRIIDSETESEKELILTAEEEEEVLKNLALSTISARQVGRNSRGSG
ncbi:hypothetical protein DAPPUDRAFT_116165 [Daphnia pulex]|uniref:Uncharacterized protein n=1 Tax=Daphnia pulex TaxID=6669 RepID=E9HNS3_DAPPU|nr:hypothetical protein DAPPUDRAFT_116165 [Daphnia pulex]|eukprot:EFX66618.1 hypothetical protein DAPPUDRAFT_116165 [Daphnia pulex]